MAPNEKPRAERTRLAAFYPISLESSVGKSHLRLRFHSIGFSKAEKNSNR